VGVADVPRQAGTGVPDGTAQFSAEDVGDLVVRQGARTGDRPRFPAVGGGVEKRCRGDGPDILGVHERGSPVAGRTTISLRWRMSPAWVVDRFWEKIEARTNVQTRPEDHSHFSTAACGTTLFFSAPCKDRNTT
jgi:hypothetical protein